MLHDLLYHHNRPIDVKVSWLCFDSMAAKPPISVPGSNAPRAKAVQSTELDELTEYNLLRLQQDDQLATDLIMAVVMKGLLNG